MSKYERQALVEALERAGGSKVQAAELLGCSRRTVYNLIAKYGINVTVKAE